MRFLLGESADFAVVHRLVLQLGLIVDTSGLCAYLESYYKQVMTNFIFVVPCIADLRGVAEK